MKNAKTSKRKAAPRQFNNKALIDASLESRGLPVQFVKAKASTLIFVHSYPNLDRVLAGGDLICRGFLKGYKNGAVAVKAHGLTVGAHVFLGMPRLKGVAKAYVESIDGDVAYISGMGVDLEGAE